MTLGSEPTVVAVGDHAVLVGLAETHDDHVGRLVRALDRAIADAGIDGVVETVPAYVNVLVVFDPIVTDHRSVIDGLRPVLVGLDDLASGDWFEAGRRVAVPVCFDAEFGPDLADVAASADQNLDDAISTFCRASFRVEMFGFQPGCGYLRGVPDELRRPRKPVPVARVAAGSVIVAGPQCLVTTLTMPTGWWVIGRSPIPMFTGHDRRPTRFDVGDEVVFEPIDRATFDRLAEAEP